MNESMSLANWIRKTDRTGRSLAREMNVSQTIVSLWARGIRRPSVDHAKAIERLSNGKVRATYLLGLE